MTRLEVGKKVRREVDGMVVTVTREGLMLREKGRRYEVGPLSYHALYLMGVRAQVDAKRREKAVTRKLRVKRGLV